VVVVAAVVVVVAAVIGRVPLALNRAATEAAPVADGATVPLTSLSVANRKPLLGPV